MPTDRYLEEIMEDPEKREKLYTWILTAQIVSVILIVIGGLFFILWAVGII